MIAQVDAKLEKEKQSTSKWKSTNECFVEEKTAALLDKVLLRASN